MLQSKELNSNHLLTCYVACSIPSDAEFGISFQPCLAIQSTAGASNSKSHFDDTATKLFVMSPWF